MVSLALRFGFTGPPERGEALLAPIRRVALPVLDSVGPMSFAAVDGIHMDPAEPLPAVFRGGLLHAAPTGLVERLLSVAGPDVDVPLAVVELRLMGGALGRCAEIPNAVAGRDGAFSLSVVAPAPPPLLAVAPTVADGVVAAQEPWSTGTSLVNFAGHEAGPERIWTTATLARLHRVKAATDPRNPFFNLGIVTLRPGQGVERHVHDAEDDSFLVLEGTLSVTLGEDGRRVQAGPGTFVLVPAGTPHEIGNQGTQEVRFLNVHAPGGFDRRIGLGN